MNLDSNSFTKVLSTTITTNCKCMDTILCFQYLCRITYLYTIVSSCLLGCISDPNTLSFESWEPKCIASEPSNLFIDHHYNCIPTEEIGLTPRKTLGWSSFDCSICRYKHTVSTIPFCMFITVWSTSLSLVNAYSTVHIPNTQIPITCHHRRSPSISPYIIPSCKLHQRDHPNDAGSIWYVEDDT